jgi:hypothetical protein
MLIKQISIFVENKKGRMAVIAKIIGDAGVDIRALSVADTTDFGILRLIVDKPDQAVKSLQDAGITVSLTDVIAVGVDDVPGAFSETMQVIADAGINIEYMYAFISRTAGRAYVIMRLEDPETGAKILKEKGMPLLDSAEIYNL